MSHAIGGAFDEMLQTRGIKKCSIHVVLRDNTKNMIKASDAGPASLPCVAHSLELAGNEMLAQRNVADAVAVVC